MSFNIDVRIPGWDQRICHILCSFQVFPLKPQANFREISLTIVQGPTFGKFVTLATSGHEAHFVNQRMAGKPIELVTVG